jgi:hypothetical protein
MPYIQIFTVSANSAVYAQYYKVGVPLVPYTVGP